MEHDGHRKRLRERFQANSLDGFAQHEILELLLTFAIPRVNTNDLAHRLIDHFGSLRGVLEADRMSLTQVKGIGENAATLLAMLLPVYRVYQTQLLEERPAIGNIRDAIALCRALLQGRRMETFFLICLNGNMRVTHTEKIAEGSVSEVAVYPRNLLASAMNHNARGVILAHNHPGGDPSPSREDIDVTMELSRMLEPVQIMLFDHIIVSDRTVYSFRSEGYFARRDEDEQTPLAAERPGRTLPPVRKRAGK